MKKCLNCYVEVHNGMVFCPCCGNESFLDIERDEEQQPFKDAFEYEEEE